MKQTEMIALGLAALAVYFIVKPKAGATKAATYDKATEILDASGKAFSNGWRYFSDGTSIDPKGNYYQGGQIVWQNPGAFV